MKQYFDIKQQYPDVIVLFQVGDFYELFFQDAQVVSDFLGITLTKRGTHNDQPIPLCGVPLHARDHYVAKLIRGGFKVALCHQLESPKPGTVVKRGVTQVLTPGMLTDSSLLDEKSASYIAALFPSRTGWGLVFAEILTSQLFSTVLEVGDVKSLESELARFLPDEIVIPQTADGNACAKFIQQRGYFVSTMQLPDSIEYDSWKQSKKLTVHPGVENAACLLYCYIQRNQPGACDHVTAIRHYAADDYMIMGSTTLSNLEIVVNQHDQSSKHTLFSIIDCSATSMGSRLLKKWLVRPSVDKEVIERRHEAVTAMLRHVTMLEKFKTVLKAIGDIERIVGRIVLGRAQRNDYVMLKYALYAVPTLKDYVARLRDSSLCAKLHDGIENYQELYDLLDSALQDDFESPWIIKSGYSHQLDQLRELVDNGAHHIIELERSEQARTGIGSLKIRYNNVHGYYIEITKTHYDAVPSDYIRTQTLSGKERYTTPALKELESCMLSAREDVDLLEQKLYQAVQQQVLTHVGALRSLAITVSHVDVVYALAQCAYDNRYVRPTFNDDQTVHIVGGRHPVVEKNMRSGFISNDTIIDDAHSTLLITGPNMGGKSTYLRQVALISIMAQCGSFVPADSANLPIFDRIFTRIGAGDNVAEGKSTFLVEMEETAYICKNSTQHSLVILDEVGRGTSTYDGLSIAQAVVEYISTSIKARCLFATHYHELTALQSSIPGIVCLHAASKRTAQGVLLLHKIIEGNAEGSFGLEVAKTADVPNVIVQRAQEIMKGLIVHNPQSYVPAVKDHEKQILHDRIAELEKRLECLKSLDLNSMSPKQVFDIVWELNQYL